MMQLRKTKNDVWGIRSPSNFVLDLHVSRAHNPRAEARAKTDCLSAACMSEYSKLRAPDWEPSLHFRKYPHG